MTNRMIIIQERLEIFTVERKIRFLKEKNAENQKAHRSNMFLKLKTEVLKKLLSLWHI